MRVSGQDYSPHEYVPIGNFYIIEKDKVSLIASGSTTTQIQELVLKDPIRRSNTPDEIRKGHDLKDSYYASVKMFNKVELGTKRKLIQTNHLCPSQEGSASVILKKDDADKWICTLMLRGSFLQNSRLESKTLINPFKKAKVKYKNCTIENQSISFIRLQVVMISW